MVSFWASDFFLENDLGKMFCCILQFLETCLSPFSEYETSLLCFYHLMLCKSVYTCDDNC